MKTTKLTSFKPLQNEVIRLRNENAELLEENKRLSEALTKANQYAVAWQVKEVQPLLGEDLDADVDYFYSLINKATS